MQEFQKYLANTEAAELLNLSAHTLRNSRSKGTLCGRQAPPYIKMGGKVLYAQSDLLEWLDGFTKFNNTSEESLEGGANEKRH